MCILVKNLPKIEIDSIFFQIIYSMHLIVHELGVAIRDEGPDTAQNGQLDVLDAQTSLTQARTTQIQAEHDYVAARARLERAIGADLAQVKKN